MTRAVASASAGPFLVAAMGFAAFLGAAGLLTLRTGVFARWTGIVALIGAVSFLITFVAVLDGLGEDSYFGFGFFPGVLALVIWSIATRSLLIARWRPRPLAQPARLKVALLDAQVSLRSTGRTSFPVALRPAHVSGSKTPAHVAR